MRNYLLTFVICSFVSLGSTFADCEFKTFAIGEGFAVGNMLEWVTSMEQNNKLFVIEKAINSTNFEEIGNVESHGDAINDQTYRFLDINAQEGSTMYRIKQIDGDGSYSYSHIVSVSNDNKNNYVIMSLGDAEASKDFKITIDSYVKGVMNYQVMTLDNEVILNDATTITDNLNDIVIPTTTFADGVYKIRLEMDEEVEELVIRKGTTVDKPSNFARKDKRR